jgi:hypothetical protein
VAERSRRSDTQGIDVIAIVLVAALALIAIDRAFLAAEARGWIYWRRRERLGFHVGASAAAELGALLSPAERTRQEAVQHTEQMPEKSEAVGGRLPGG